MSAYGTLPPKLGRVAEIVHSRSLTISLDPSLSQQELGCTCYAHRIAKTDPLLWAAHYNCCPRPALSFLPPLQEDTVSLN